MSRQNDYVPTTEEVRQQWGWNYPDYDNEDAAFDRWLAEMKAEAVNAYIAEQEMKAETIETVGNMINTYKTPANNVRPDTPKSAPTHRKLPLT